MENKTIFLLRDCVETSCVYGAIIINGKFEIEEIEQVIYEIKYAWENQGKYYWTLQDLWQELSVIYDFEIIEFNGTLEV